MGRIPQRFIDDLLARTDIVEIIQSYVPLKKRGREHIACCPFHNEKTPSFTVSGDKQFYHCFGCGAHGTALGFLLDYEHLDFVEAVEALAARTGLAVPQTDSGVANEEYDDLYQILEEATRYYKAGLRDSPEAVEYLKRRGLSGEIAHDYRLGYAPSAWQHLDQLFSLTKLGALTRAGLVKQSDSGRTSARFRNRIMFPIRDRRGRVIGFGGRVLDDSQPKYLNSPETPLFRKGESLYGLFELRKAGGRPSRVFVVEGYMDVLALAQHDVRNAIATLGTSTTHDHLQQVFRESHEIVFCFDGDRAGRQAAWRAVQQLLPIFRDGSEARFMFLPEGDDPDSLIRREGKDAFLKRATAAISLSDYFFEHLAEGLDISGAEGRARLAELAKPLLRTLPDSVFKQLMFDELARQVGTSKDKLGLSIQTKPGPGRGTDPRPTINSPVRIAIAMLLNDPKLAQQAPMPDELERLQLPGVPLLIHILETLRDNPHLNSASLLERYRNTEHQRHLLRLMAWQPPSGDFDLATQFHHTLRKLVVQWVEQRTTWLLEKESAEGANPDERRELQELLARKGRALKPNDQEEI